MNGYTRHYRGATEQSTSPASKIIQKTIFQITSGDQFESREEAEKAQAKYDLQSLLDDCSDHCGINLNELIKNKDEFIRLLQTQSF